MKDKDGKVIAASFPIDDFSELGAVLRAANKHPVPSAEGSILSEWLL